jgi:hypothetical protein
VSGHGRHGVHRQLWLAGLLALAAVLMAIWIVRSAAAPTYVPPKCAEDSQCWDCSKMGNLTCGRS